MSKEIGERLREVRRRTGVSQSQVAGVLALDTSAVSRIENGERHLSAFELGVLASTYRWDPRELLGIQRPRPKLALAARLRESSGSPQQAFDRMAALVEVDALLDEAGLDDRAPGLLISDFRPSPSSEAMARKEGRELVKIVLDRTATKAPTTDLVGFAEKSLGLDVVITEVPGDCDGAIAVGDKVAVAIVDTRTMSGRQRFTLAHEIGHAVAGDVVDEVYVDHAGHRSLAEIRADSFAANLLMPDDPLRAILDGQLGPIELVEAMVTFGVSWTALRRRCADLGIEIPAHLRNATGVELFTLAGRGAEEPRVSAPIPARIPARLDRRVRKAYSKALVGAGVVAMAYGLEGEAVELVLASIPMAFKVPGPQVRSAG